MKVEFKQHSRILHEIANRISVTNYEEVVFKSSFPLDNIWVLGAGKASLNMAESIISTFGSRVEDGIIISNEDRYGIKGIQVFEGAHPYPDKKSVSASYELLELARKIPEGETVVFCLSGGASSLLCIPPGGIEIDELAYTYKLLLECGASIHEINVVRKHLCELKGGQLAQALHHTNLVTLVASDVPGDDLETIGSSPTICDPSTFKEAFQVLKRFELWNLVPHSIRIYIAKGMNGDIPETPKPGINDHPGHEIKTISKISSLGERVEQVLRKEGFNTWLDNKAYDDDVRKVSKMICSKAISVLSKDEPLAKPAALIFYGESSVNVKGSGKGGRNQELALISAISLEGHHSISMLSLGTDGIDGPTDAAGAIINSETTLKARKAKLSPEEFLQNNDSYNFHEEMGTIIKTGSTGNNTADLQVVIIE
ncbi:MAG: DUF4147 domain-containing protein [Balneolaceae bacterium]